MNIKKIHWWLGGGPNVGTDDTTSDGKQLFLIIGDSIARGTSPGPGPTPTAGTVFEWDGAQELEVSNSDLTDAVDGSPWPRFGINYNSAIGKKPVFINCGSGGAEFYPNGDNNNWYTSGTLYAAMQTKSSTALSNYGLTKLKGIFVILGVNDIRAATLTADVTTGINSLRDRLLSDFPNTPIYFVIPGRTESVTVDLRSQFVRSDIRRLYTNNSNLHVAATLTSFVYWALYDTDNLHLTDSGNDKLGEILCKYVVSAEADKNTRMIISNFHSSISDTRKQLIRNFITAVDFENNVDSLMLFKGGVANDMMFNWGMSPLTSVAGTPTFNTDFATLNGTNQNIRNGNHVAAATNKCLQNNFISYVKIKTNRTPVGTAGFLKHGSASSIQVRIGQNASSQTFYSANDNTANVYATDTKIQDDTIYATARNPSDPGKSLLIKGDTIVSSLSVASTGNMSLQEFIGSTSAAASFLNADIEFEMRIKYGDLTVYKNAIDALIAGWNS